MNLEDLPNVGKVLRRTLSQIGVETPEQLREIGAEEAFLMIRDRADHGACLHMLYGIQGAIDGVIDNKLPEETKTRLKDFYKSLK